MADDVLNDDQRPLSQPFFPQALAAAGKDNFLGNRTTIDSLLRLTVSDFIDKYLVSKSKQDRINIKSRYATKLASILIGENDDFEPLLKWNEPGAIDVFCAKWLGSAETDPKQRMIHSVVLMFNDILNLADYVGVNGVLDEQWQWQVNEIIDRYVGIFLGVDPVVQMATVLGNNEPQEVKDDE